MKTTIAVLSLLFCLTMNAQKHDKRENARADMAPQEIASMQAKKMTLALDLTDQQQKQVEKVLTTVAEKRKAMAESKGEKKELSKEERLKRREKVLDEKIEVKRQMKSILTEAQYEKWESQMDKRRKGNKKSMEQRRGKKQ